MTQSLQLNDKISNSIDLITHFLQLLFDILSLIFNCFHFVIDRFSIKKTCLDIFIFHLISGDMVYGVPAMVTMSITHATIEQKAILC